MSDISSFKDYLLHSPLQTKQTNTNKCHSLSTLLLEQQSFQLCIVRCAEIIPYHRPIPTLSICIDVATL